jgi:hypothetical protein
MELEKLEQRADVLLVQIERNAKKIRQTMQNGGQWDVRRISANVRMMNELEYILTLINCIWENPERDVTAFN